MNNANYRFPKILDFFLNQKYLLALVLICIAILYVHTGLTSYRSHDDYFHRLVFEHPSFNGVSNIFIDFFNFSIGGTHSITEKIASIGIPWWIDLDLKIHFFRPVSVLTHWLDHQLWPNNYLLFSLHSLAWYLATIFLAFKVYQLVFKDRKLAALGLLLFALCYHHYIPVLWIPARNALIAGFFSILCFYCYYRAVTTHWRTGFILTPIVLCIALLSGEASLGVTAFLFSCALFIDKRAKKTALLSLLPAAIVSIIWLYYYQHMGFGTSNSGYYITPFEDLSAYINRFVTGVPLLAFSALTNFELALLTIFHQAFVFVLIISILLLAFCVYHLVIPLIKKDPMVPFWLLAFIISLAPACGVAPSGRTLFLPGVAFIGLLISIFKNLLAGELALNYIRQKLVALILFLQLAMPIIILIALNLYIPKAKDPFLSYHYAYKNYNISPNSTILNISEISAQPTITAIKTLLNGGFLATEIIDLFYPAEEFTLRRVGDKALIVASTQSKLIRSYRGPALDLVLRDTYKNPISAGDKFKAGSIDIEILKADETLGPIQILYTFPRSLDNPEYILLMSNANKETFTKIAIPKVGHSAMYSRSALSQQ